MEQPSSSSKASSHAKRRLQKKLKKEAEQKMADIEEKVEKDSKIKSQAAQPGKAQAPKEESDQKSNHSMADDSSQNKRQSFEQPDASKSGQNN